MAAASANRVAPYVLPGSVRAYPCGASKTIYKGTAVALAVATGHAEALTAATSKKFVGVSTKYIVSSSTAGADTMEVASSGEFEFIASGTATAVWVGKKVYFLDDQTVVRNTGVTTKILAGVVTEFISATKVMVRVDSGVAADTDGSKLMKFNIIGDTTHSEKKIGRVKFATDILINQLAAQVGTAVGASGNLQVKFVYSTAAGTATTKTVTFTTSLTAVTVSSINATLPAGHLLEVSAVDSVSGGDSADLTVVMKYYDGNL